MIKRWWRSGRGGGWSFATAPSRLARTGFAVNDGPEFKDRVVTAVRMKRGQACGGVLELEAKVRGTVTSPSVDRRLARCKKGVSLVNSLAALPSDREDGVIPEQIDRSRRGPAVNESIEVKR
jgi:hypothetical protein